MPIATSIYASNSAFLFYYKGIVHYEYTRENGSLNHGLIIVGYGVSDEGVEYYICKNSWGTDWGEDGYVRMAV